MLGAVFSHLAGRKLAAVRVPSTRDDSSRFLIVPEQLREVVVTLEAATKVFELETFLGVLRSATAAVHA